MKKILVLSDVLYYPYILNCCRETENLVYSVKKKERQVESVIKVINREPTNKILFI